ncbi:MAG: leucine-responsive transcriptional regulator, partial [Shewanella sp.]
VVMEEVKHTSRVAINHLLSDI